MEERRKLRTPLALCMILLFLLHYLPCYSAWIFPPSSSHLLDQPQKSLLRSSAASPAIMTTTSLAKPQRPNHLPPLGVTTVDVNEKNDKGTATRKVSSTTLPSSTATTTNVDYDDDDVNSNTTTWIPRLAFVVISLMRQKNYQQQSHSRPNPPFTMIITNDDTEDLVSSLSSSLPSSPSLDRAYSLLTNNATISVAKAISEIIATQQQDEQMTDGMVLLEPISNINYTNNQTIFVNKNNNYRSRNSSNSHKSLNGTGHDSFFSFPRNNPSNHTNPCDHDDNSVAAAVGTMEKKPIGQAMWNLTNDLVVNDDDEDEQLPPSARITPTTGMDIVEEQQGLRDTNSKGNSRNFSAEMELLNDSSNTTATTAAISKNENSTIEPEMEARVVVDDASSRRDDVDDPSFSSNSNIRNEEAESTLPRPLSFAAKNHQDRVDRIRQRASDISHSFFAKTFRPAWFATNPHFQTIVGTLARQESMYFPVLGHLVLSNFQWDERQHVETADGDFFHVDWKFTPKPVHDPNWLTETSPWSSSSPSTPVVLICHGLQSNTDSPLVKDMAIAYNTVGMDVAAINFRGCSRDEINRTPMGYHLSYTKDLQFLVDQLSKSQPGRPIYLSGFSLGANVVTNFLADLGVRAVEEYNICGAAVNAVPFDLTTCQSINEPGFSGRVYGDRLVRSLKDRVLESMDQGVEYNFTRKELENCTNCKEFDDLVVCSVYDEFDNATDYHRKSSTIHRLSEIMVPQFIIQALDDPFFANSKNPDNNSSLPCRIHYSDFGGHCGFIFHSEERDKKESSFMPTELARFVQHVHQVRTGQKSSQVALRTSPPLALRLTPERIGEELQHASLGHKVRRTQACRAAHTFQPRDFVPVPWARNEHLQTIVGALFRRQTMYVMNSNHSPMRLLLSSVFTNERKFQWDERQRVQTPDGDFFDVDWKYAKNDNDDDSTNKTVVLICHGLQSDSSSPLAQDMATAFGNIGMDAACINCRGCSGEINQTPIGYHLGFTEDLHQMIRYVHQRYPHRRIYLSGFSLGANLVTTCLAELGERAYDYNVFGAAVNAVPFDMTKAHVNLNRNGLTKSLYGSRLLASMMDRVEQCFDRGIQFPFPREEARKCRTIMDMENLVIAPIFGFRDAYDYYEQASSLSKIDRVAVPELVIQSEDDPFFLGQSIPDFEDKSRPLRVQMTQHGGHCGYVFHSCDDRPLPRDGTATSWMPTELARFLLHLETTFSSAQMELASSTSSVAEEETTSLK